MDCVPHSCRKARDPLERDAAVHTWIVAQYARNDGAFDALTLEVGLDAIDEERARATQQNYQGGNHLGTSNQRVGWLLVSTTYLPTRLPTWLPTWLVSFNHFSAAVLATTYRTVTVQL